jgi:hypothetical protein
VDRKEPWILSIENDFLTSGFQSFIIMSFSISYARRRVLSRAFVVIIFSYAAINHSSLDVVSLRTV